mgnify:CR=1 FL=1
MPSAFIITTDARVLTQDARPFVLQLSNEKLAALPAQAVLPLPSHHLGAPDYAIDSQCLVDNGLLQTASTDEFVYRGITLHALAYRTLLQYLDTSSAHALSYALQLANFRQTELFCRCCGTAHMHTQGYSKHCHHCGQHSYPPVAPCVIVAICRVVNQQKQLLLARHHRHKTPMFGLIAGFVEIGESMEQAVCREVYEETRLQVDNICYVTSQPYPYPSNLMLGFTANYAGGQLQIDECELVEAAFFTADNLPNIPPKGTIAHRLIQQVLA